MDANLLLPLVCFGICLILIEGSIFKGFRDWLVSVEGYFVNRFFKWLALKANQLFNCYMCLGFQVGWVIGFMGGPYPAWNILYNGAYYAAVVWVIHSIVQYLGNGNDPNRSVIVQFPDTIKVEIADPPTVKDINK
jgi:hypothetical protein